MRPVDVVVLSKFPEIFEGFRECVDKDRYGVPTKKIVIWDRDSKMDLDLPQRWKDHWGWTASKSDLEFKISRNANLGWGFTENDILYCGDDTRIVESDTIARLQAAAYSDPHIGIISPRIDGTCCVGAPLLVPRPDIQIVTYVGFVFVYIKRDVVEEIGFLDERFEGYGTEDLDYCYRARRAGFKIAVAPHITVKHGVNGHTYGSTFIRVKGETQMGKDDNENRRRFAEKWGIQNDVTKIMEFIDAGK